VGVNSLGIVFHLAGLDFFQQVGNVFMIAERHLDAHVVQALHCGLAHAAANEKLAVFEIVEFGHVRRIAALAMTVLVVMIVLVVVIIFARVWQTPQLLFDDLAISEGDDEKGLGLAEVPGNRCAVIGGNRYFE